MNAIDSARLDTVKKPNFFLIGAPKCGTTSLDAWLASHPRIFTAPKEPDYFNTVGRGIKNLRDYEALFAGAGEQHLAVGETSPKYLRCPDAVGKILRYNADAKFIVIVRNPVDMAASWHTQQLRNDNENVTDFETAWNLQEERRAGRRLPRFCYNAANLLYGDVCALGRQLQRVYERAPAERVHVVVFEDLKNDPAGVYRSVLNFLPAPDGHQPNFAVHNPAQVRRVRYASRMLLGAHVKLARIKTALGIRRSFNSMKLVNRLNRLNTKPDSRRPLSPRLRQTLTAYFAGEVRLLEQLLGRDLSHWRHWR